MTQAFVYHFCPASDRASAVSSATILCCSIKTTFSELTQAFHQPHAGAVYQGDEQSHIGWQRRSQSHHLGQRHNRGNALWGARALHAI